jgi:NAD(P)-dependent dehydrogenase (short-subunit alcohol dehydrogenase family)
MKIVIIGADKGLGLVLVHKFLANGHDVVAGHVFPAPPDSLLSIKDGADRLHLVQTDVTKEPVMEKAAAQVMKELGPVDVLICVAGILVDGDRVNDLLHMDMADMRLTMEINAIGSAIMFKHFYPVMRKDGQGIMVSVTSEGGRINNLTSKRPAYGISKIAANKIVAIMRKTVSDVTIYAMHPGRMNTEMGYADAQIEPQESADSIYDLLTGKKPVSPDADWFINYKGEPMPM